MKLDICVSWISDEVSAHIFTYTSAHVHTHVCFNCKTNENTQVT